MRRLVITATLVAFCGLGFVVADAPKDTPAAAATRKKLKVKLSVDYKETRLADIVMDLKEKIEDVTGMNISFHLDNPGGVSNNQTITFAAQNMPVEEILNEMFEKAALGYIVASGKFKNSDRYDGWVIITKGKERGYPEGQEPSTPVVKEQPKEEPKDTPKVEDPADADKDEAAATATLKTARKLIDFGLADKAKPRLEEILKKYPKTKAAEEAKTLLDKLNK
ncbi:MAG: tetratricopeptide repeat protein [Gemmataceae bacterium]